MTRFDPKLYPGRFVIEARAQELRSAELARLQQALGAWLGGCLRALAAWAHLGPTHAHRPQAH